MLKNLIYASAILAGVSIPLSTKGANLSVAVLCVLSIIYCYKNNRLRKSALKVLIFSSLSLFLIALLGVFITGDIDTAFKHLGRRSLFLLVPFSLCFYDKKHLKGILTYSLGGLVAGCLISGTFLLTQTLKEYFQTRLLSQIGFDLFNYYHTYHNFTAPLNFHPTYLGSYFFLSILATLHYLNTAKEKKMLAYSVLLLLLVFSLFINSRIILGLIFLSLVFYFSKLIINVYHRSVKKFFILTVISILLSIVIFSFFKNTYIYYRFTSELQWESSKQINTQINENNGGDSRLARWEAIVNIIKEKPLLGHGTGNEKDILEKKFQEEGMSFSAENKYDSHNLYLSYSVQFGLLGLLVLMIFYYRNLMTSIQTGDWVYLLLVVGLVFISLFENYLNNNAGIVFISLFLNLFLFSNLKKHEFFTKKP